ncbi:RsmD family RNA methyltransferase [Candidatus Woesearchaeota archaeon]|nr:RsmD family RNA methyltransferase [Candidatus Woesearchaeota archaeon]MCF7901694.1 RsmD family RNA methyltransferase [Candidatus Woesearchaeota archaeon]MCF8013268.1 RsmD family RNA methyltransferase [Candidatus Woesearchaeota archaeon]
MKDKTPNKYLFELSKENIKISKSEAKIIIEKILDGQSKEIENTIISITPQEIKVPNRNLERLAYTKKISKIILESKEPQELSKKIITTKIKEFQGTKKNTFKINIINMDHKNIKFAEIGDFVKNLKLYKKFSDVNLNNPEIEINILKLNKKYYLTQTIWENKENFEKRKSHNRPAPHPTSMNPKLARAIVNMSGAKKEILDPFCGAGGILIEAKMIGLKTKGLDIDHEMIIRAKMNLKNVEGSPTELKKMDALTYNQKIEAIVTDVPYGKSSILKQKLSDLVEEFLIKYQKLTKTIILTHPSTINVKKLLKQTKWTIKEQHNIFIHKSLTRTITKLEQ